MGRDMEKVTYPVVDGFPNQPDDRIKAQLFGKPLPDTYLARLELAMSMAVSCLTLYADPEPAGTGNSYLRKDDHGQYAREIIDEVTYLQLAPLPDSKAQKPA